MPIILTFSHWKVDVIFGGEILGIDNFDDVTRVGDDGYFCAKAGASMMTRKDMVHKFAWFDKGMEMLKANGDYAWLCNINSNGKFNPLSPHDALEHHFTSLKTNLIFLQLGVLEQKIPWNWFTNT